MSAARFASAAVNSRVASFAVLRFDPTAMMPPSIAATVTAHNRGVKLDRTTQDGDET